MATPRLINKMSHSFVQSFSQSVSRSVFGFHLSFTIPQAYLLSMKYLSGAKFIVVQLHCR